MILYCLVTGKCEGSADGHAPPDNQTLYPARPAKPDAASPPDRAVEPWPQFGPQTDPHLRRSWLWQDHAGQRIGPFAAMM
jgi:hypothetical protein